MDMKTTLIAAMAVLGMALVALAYAAPVSYRTTAAGSGYRIAATDSEGDGGTNPYAATVPAHPVACPSVPT
jgi:hypothetical protein